MGLSFLFNWPNDNSHQWTKYSLLPADGSRAYQDVLIAGFMFLQIFGGHLGIPIVLLTTAFSKNVRRNPVLISFLSTWVIYATSFTLVLYAGKQVGPEPPIQLCIVQAALIYGAPVMTSMAGLALVLHLWFSFRKGEEMTGGGRVVLLISPFILFIVFSVIMAVIGSLNPETVSRSRTLFYCNIDLKVVNIVPGTTAIIILVAVVFEVLIAIKLHGLRGFKTMGHTNDGGIPLHHFIRVGIFTLYSCLGFLTCVIFGGSFGGSNEHNDPAYLGLATMPTAAFLIFGMQGDILRVWGITAVVEAISQRLSRPSSSNSNTLPVMISTGHLRNQGNLYSTHSDAPRKVTPLANNSINDDQILDIC